MSAGAFNRSLYQATYDPTQIHRIRVQPETEAAAIGAVTNAPPAGPVTNPISAKSSCGKTEIGLCPRMVTIQADADVANVPAGYQPRGITRIPCLTPAFFAAAVTATTLTYLGETWEVVSTSPEVTN